MDRIKNNVNLPLLYEVRKDAFAKSRDAEQTERLFRMMHYVDILVWTVRKEGMLALEDAVKKIPLEIGFDQDMQYAVSLCVDGVEPEDLMEILTARYWRKNLQGEDALLYYMIILSVLRIQDGISPYRMENLLMACLSDEAAGKYAEYKKQRQSLTREKTPMEYLLNSEPSLGEGGILIVKKLLEKRIEYSDKKILKSVIRDAKENDLVISLKGLSISARRKLFSVIPDRKAEEYAGDCESMGPVRQIDVMASMSELIFLFEKLAKSAERQDEKHE